MNNLHEIHMSLYQLLDFYLDLIVLNPSYTPVCSTFSLQDLGDTEIDRESNIKHLIQHIDQRYKNALDNESISRFFTFLAEQALITESYDVAILTSDIAYHYKPDMRLIGIKKAALSVHTKK